MTFFQGVFIFFFANTDIKQSAGPVVLHCGYNRHKLRKLAIYRDFLALKNENFQLKFFDIFLIFAENIDCGYALDRGGSNKYPQSMFWSKNKKNRYTPAYPSISI